MPTKIDLIAEATGGLFHTDDLCMDDFEGGKELFPVGARVEARTLADEKTRTWKWRKGTIVETSFENDRGIHVFCDEKFHDGDFLDGHGACVMSYMVERRHIMSAIRKINEPPKEIEGATSIFFKLYEIIKIAAEESDGRLRVAFNESEGSEEPSGDQSFSLKLDEKFLYGTLEIYEEVFKKNYDRGPYGINVSMAAFHDHVILPLQEVGLLSSYEKATAKLTEQVITVLKAEIVKWQSL